MPQTTVRTTTLSVSWTRTPALPEIVTQPNFSGINMGAKVLKTIVKSKAGRIVLGSLAAGAVGTVGVVVTRRWVRNKLAERERRKLEAAAEKERQRLAAEAEKERQRLAAAAEKERQRLAAEAEKERQRAAALKAQAQRKAERRAELESTVGTALNRAFARLGLNLRAEVSAQPPAPAAPTKTS